MAVRLSCGKITNTGSSLHKGNRGNAPKKELLVREITGKLGNLPQNTGNFDAQYVNSLILKIIQTRQFMYIHALL